MNNWRIFDVSRIGPKHQRNKMPNQDSAISVSLKYCDVIVVADGVGSHQFSHLGSQAICQAVIRVCKMLDKQIEIISPKNFSQLVYIVWQSLLYHHDIAQCGTTCLIGIKISEKMLIFTLGDGMAVVLDEHKQTHFLINDNKEFGNITYALNETYQEQHWKMYQYPIEKILMLMLCTDGIADDIEVDKRESWVLDFYDYYQHHSLKNMTNDIKKWLKNWSVNNHHDDKSMACMIR